jgi:hypothetical protein
MLTRSSGYWATAFGGPARQAFPEVKHSNFGLWGSSKEYCSPTPDGAGFLGCRAGSGSSGLSVHAPAFYYNIETWSCHTTVPDKPCNTSGPGIDVALKQFAGVPYDSFNKTGFNILVLHGNSKWTTQKNPQLSVAFLRAAGSGGTLLTGRDASCAS